jgi:hypothetical protein
MPKLDGITLRVDGQPIETVEFRFSMEDGFPGGRPELVVQDANLGEIILSSTCKIEIDEGSGFHPITLHALIAMLRTSAEGM